MISLLLAVSLQFSGVLGQSAAADEEPLCFTGVRALSDGPDGRVFLIGDDGNLYEIVGGRVKSCNIKMPGFVLDWDGRTFRHLGYNDVWEINPQTLALRHVFGSGKHRFDEGACVVPDGSPFSTFGRYIVYEKGQDRLVGLDEKGEVTRELFPLPVRKAKSQVCGLGLLPCGDLVVVTYYPDLRSYRFKADGTQVFGKGWPSGGFGWCRRSGGQLYHCGRPACVRLEDNLSAAHNNRYAAANESSCAGYARQGDVEYLATSQGLFVRGPGEESFSRRLGGIAPLKALAVNGKYVYMSMSNGTMRWMYLDEPPTGPFASDDGQGLRVNGGWSYNPLDLAPAEGDDLLVATGKGGKWRFNPFPQRHVAGRDKRWTRLSTNACTQVSAPIHSEIKSLVAKADVPRGLEPGKMALQGSWLVVEDRKNARLLRFKIAEEVAR